MRIMVELPPAPGEDLFPALALVNTRFERAGAVVDTLATPEAALAWLNVPAVEDTDVVAAVRTLRESIRTLLLARAGATDPPDHAVETLNQVLRAGPTVPRLYWLPGSSPERRRLPLAGNPVELALAALATDALRLLTGPEAELVTECGANGCIRLLLRTHPKRQWCSNRCGDRVRAARHYARTRTVSPAGPATA